MLRDKEKIVGPFSRMTDDYKSRKRKNNKNKPMNPASTFAMLRAEEKLSGALCRITSDYRSRKRENSKPINLASIFRKLLRQRKNNRYLISRMTSDYINIAHYFSSQCGSPYSAI